MKIVKAIKLEKYNDIERYSSIDENIYKDFVNDTYCLTLYCFLEDGEDTQYPLEDILDQYYVNCTDYLEEKQVNGKNIYIFEIEGSLMDADDNLKNIQGVSDLIGKRVFNYEDGDYIKFGIE